MNLIEGIELYDVSALSALEPAINAVAERCNVSKKDAKKLVLNSLLYSVVINEIESHCAWMCGQDDL